MSGPVLHCLDTQKEQTKCGLTEDRKKELKEVSLTVKEVALILKISNKTVYDLIARGRLPGVVRYGRAIRFNGNVFREWLDNCSCTVMPEGSGT